MKTVRATASFHGAPYYDTVAVERERVPNSPGRDGQHWYGQLRVLYLMKTTDGTHHQMAMIRWFQHVDSSSPLDRLALQFGCRRLSWASQMQQGERRAHYIFIPLDSIVSR